MNYITVPFSKKEEAKRLGARFDGNEKKWYIPDGLDSISKNALISNFGGVDNVQQAENCQHVDNKNTDSCQHVENNNEKNIHHVENNDCQHSDNNTEENFHHVENNNIHNVEKNDENNCHHVEKEMKENNQHVEKDNIHHVENNQNSSCQHVEKKSNEMNRNTAPSSESWQKALDNYGNVSILVLLKKYGMPTDIVTRAKFFRRLNNLRPGDYPVSYEGLKIYYPELTNLYPEAELKEKIASVTTGSNYRTAISENTHFREDEKALMLFILP